MIPTRVAEQVLKGLAFCYTLKRLRVGFDGVTSAIRSCQIWRSMALGPGKPEAACDSAFGHGSVREDLI